LEGQEDLDSGNEIRTVEALCACCARPAVMSNTKASPMGNMVHLVVEVHGHVRPWAAWVDPTPSLRRFLKLYADYYTHEIKEAGMGVEAKLRNAIIATRFGYPGGALDARCALSKGCSRLSDPQGRRWSSTLCP
jgi:hypothetical protein